MKKFRTRRQIARSRQFKSKRGMALRRGLGLPRGAPLVHKFKEWCELPSITCPAGALNGGTLTVALNNLSNHPAIVALFDLYKITALKFKFVPSWNVGLNTTMGPGGSTLPNLYLAPNHDPYVPAPTSVQDILNDDGVRIIRPTRPFTFYLKNPNARITNKDGSDIPIINNSGYGARSRPWLTTGGNSQVVDQSAVPHYGLRWLLDDRWNPATSIEMQTFVCVYFMTKEQD